MSRVVRGLFGLVKALLWFVLRLLILAITGSWIASREREEGPQQTSDPSGGLEGSGGEWDPQLASPRELSATLVDLDTRLRDARNQAVGLRRAGNLPGALDALQAELTEQRREASEPDFALATRVQQLDLALSFVERSLRHRQRDAGLEAWLAALDRLADDLDGPVVELLDSHGTPRHPRHWVSALGRLTESQHQALAQTPVGALDVERGLSREPQSWPALAPRVARKLLLDVPGLLDELYRRHGLPAAVPLPHSHVGIGSEEVHGALGVWLETLFADTYACLRLGPAYARFLLGALAETGPVQRAHAATASGGWLSPVPPRSVRMHTVVRVLDLLGQHQEEEDIWEAWTARHGEMDSLFFPTADGHWNAIPAAYFFAQLEPLLDSLTIEPLASLAQTAMVSVPDLEFAHADDANHQRLRKMFAEGRHESHAPYVALAAAARAVAEDGADPAVVARAAQMALGVPDALAGEAAHGATHPAAVGRGRKRRASSEPRTLAAAVRSRRIQREAIVLGGALGRRAPPRRRLPG